MSLLNHICTLAWIPHETYSRPQVNANEELERSRHTWSSVSVSQEGVTTSRSPAKIIDERWRQFFSDPSQWWDHRSGKTSAKFPDFKHKQTQEALWLDGRLIPEWVESELAATASGTLQLSLDSCNKLLVNYLKDGHNQKALDLFQQMQHEGMTPNKRTFIPVLKACSTLRTLEDGRQIHLQIIQDGFESDIFVCTSLVDMYAKCGKIEDAFNVFKRMPKRDVVSWNAIILGHAKCGQGQKALELFREMLMEQIEPAPLTFIGVLNACASLEALDEGKHTHAQIIESGCESNMFVGNSLVNMYAKCGSIEDALIVFEKMPRKDVVSWNTMIQGLVKSGQGQKALEVYLYMQLEGVKPSPITFLGVLNACAMVGALEEGRRLHEQIIESGYESHTMVGNSLVNMYAKCGSMVDAQRVFKTMHKRDAISWNAMILAHVKCGQREKALEYYKEMQEEGLEPDNFTFVSVLSACASLGALEEGRRVHAQITQSACVADLFVYNSLVDMYAKCGSIEDAKRIFSKMVKMDVVSWNAMIFGHVNCGQAQEALVVYQQMKLASVEADGFTFVGALKACAMVGTLKEGRSVHSEIVKSEHESDHFVESSLVDMYAKCGSIEDAQIIFDKMSVRDVVSWNAMILGRVKCGQGQKAFELLKQMQAAEVVPDTMTFVAALNTCANVAALNEGRRVHAQIIQRGCESDLFVSNGLIDMYAKCGTVEDAQRVFQTMPVKDVVSWNSMLGGYSMHGYINEAISLFEQMREASVKMDSVTFTSLLSACSHAGLLEEGLHYFESLSLVYGISARLEHYACMVDLLGRSGHLHEAENMIEAMSCEPDVTLWMTLLAACRVHSHVEMAERIAKRVLQMDPGNAASYVVLANIYAAAGKWDSRETLQRTRIKRGVHEELGNSWIEVNSMVHLLHVDDQVHPQISEIRAEVERWSNEMKQAGLILHDVGDAERPSHTSCYHSEKLAIALGLMNTPSGNPLRIVKDVRVCDDCHSATKFISKISGRPILIRDNSCFHHFKDGTCTCQDFW